MPYKALYRTYRPSTFEEVAGQQAIIKTLKNALETGKLSHAYLFAGPKGTGKTSMAKLLAKALNCDEGIGHICNHCKNCLAINEGNHPDVIEIDAASNNGVEQVRDIVEKVKYGTILGRYKVYIIDEVHMMSTGAFNALLKTLEEPPEHVIFILATTEPYKILPTILSRCQRYDFTNVSDKDMEARLKTVLANENISYDQESVDLLVSLSGGAVRDILSMLDQIVAYSGNKLVKKDILEIFSLESNEEKINLLEGIIDGKASYVLKRLNYYIDKGTDIKRLTSDLLYILKDLLVFMNTRDSSLLEKLTYEQAMEISKKVKSKQVMQMIDIFMDTNKTYKEVSQINSVFEITLLKLLNLFEKKEESVDIKQEDTVVHSYNVQEEKKEIVTPIKDTVIIDKKPSNEIEQTSIFDYNPNEDAFSKSVIIPKDVTGEETFQMDDKLIIDVMVTAKKEIKNELSDKWSSLNRLVAHPILGQAAALLCDSHLLVASNKIMIVECPTTNMVNKINAKNLQENLQNTLISAFHHQMFVYAVSRNTSVELQNKYKNLYQVGKLPKANTINIEFLGEE